MTIRYGSGLSEYTCPICGSQQLRAGRFVPVPEEERFYKGEERRLPEICGNIPTDPNTYAGLCRGEMVWTPTASQTDLLGENFIVDLDGKPTKISSLTELRTLERDSLRRAANGEGAPLVFRRLSQDHSNRDVNTLRGSEYEKKRQIPIDRRTRAGMITARATDKPRE